MSVINLTLERYPTTDLLKLLANILTHIAQTNDRNPPVSIAGTTSGIGSEGVSTSTLTLTSAAKTVLLPPSSPTSPTGCSTATTITNTVLPLTFHARNVPTISLELYLLRILKYCPTSNFVFLSLLVYFDRMAALSLVSSGNCNGVTTNGRIFRVDSYNVHRLVIAGVTVASKFFSDVFYTNSRYAKVGGLPLPELNQLELQFLLLNDFRLVISPQQMHVYTQRLISFSLDHPPPSMGTEIEVLAASLGPSLVYPIPQLPPAPRNKNRNRNTTTTTTTTTTTQPGPSPPFPPPSPPLRPSSSPSPSPSNSSSSSLISSPSASPRPRRMISNGHPHLHSLLISNPKHCSLVDEETSDSNDSYEERNNDSDEDHEETETLTSTSTDDDSEPTIRGPSTVVGWATERVRKSP